MRYAKALFDLQLQFADAVTRISGMPLSRALFEYTNLYIRFGAGRDFDPAHPIWPEYLAGLEDADDRSEWTYHRQSTMDDLEQCFPLRILRVEAPVSDFYEFYGV